MAKRNGGADEESGIIADNEETRGSWGRNGQWNA